MKDSGLDEQTTESKNGVQNHGKTNSSPSIDKIEVLEKATEKAKKDKKKDR